MNHHEDESEHNREAPHKLPSVTMRISADGKAILFFCGEPNPNDDDPEDSSFYDLCFSEIKSRGIPHWRDHLSRKNWFGDEQHRQFLRIIESFLP